MGLYLNPGNQSFGNIVRSGDYVDKSGLIKYTNGRIDKPRPLVASSRPRRFGKSLAVQMLAAYYSKGCDSREIFSELEIGSDPAFEKHLNQYDVLCLDIQWMRGIALAKMRDESENSIIGYIQKAVVRELMERFPDIMDAEETVVASALASINDSMGIQFVILIDEWDCFFREDKDNKALLKEYIDFLRSLFKGQQADRFVKLAYITGILPIKKYGTQSALNNFRELTMVNPGGIAPYIGFTKDEVQSLCEKHNMPFEEMQTWYDGYILSYAGHVYSPNSVMEAIDNGELQNYWTQTETYESLKVYIEMNFDGLRQKIVNMLAGERCLVETRSFQNDMTSLKSSDDVLTLLIHLGYLAYDSKTKEAFIPNEEVRDSFVLSVMDGSWGEVFDAIRQSERLLAATLAMDEAKVADMIRTFHSRNSSSLVYNNEVSLASVIQIAYYSAAKDYTLIRELPTGEGFADMVFLPKYASGKPALVVELKWNQSAEGAIQQIKDRRYADALRDFKGNILLVGINYDKDSKQHDCRIEKLASAG